MRELNVTELELVNGGTITNNPDGTQTTDDPNDCADIYGDGLLSRGDRLTCEADVIMDGSHTTKKD